MKNEMKNGMPNEMQTRTNRPIFFLGFFTLVILSLSETGCKTKSEIRREQELDRIKQEVTQSRGDRADVETNIDELKVEIARFGNVIEEEAQGRRHENEEIKKELTAIAARIQALEQRAVAEELQSKQVVNERSKASLDSGRRLFDEGKYDEAIETLKIVAKSQGKNEEGKKAQFLLAESYFSSKDYASAALEYSEFRKNFPKDALVPNAIYRQASSFKGMGKTKEARLFFQDLIERYPKSPFASKAKADMRKVK